MTIGGGGGGGGGGKICVAVFDKVGIAESREGGGGGGGGGGNIVECTCGGGGGGGGGNIVECNCGGNGGGGGGGGGSGGAPMPYAVAVIGAFGIFVVVANLVLGVNSAPAPRPALLLLC